VVRGHPTDEETAALTVVLAARLAAGPPAGREPGTPRRAGTAGGWADRARALRIPPVPGRGAWRRAGLPPA
jgi:hypothetical protein